MRQAEWRCVVVENDIRKYLVPSAISLKGKWRRKRVYVTSIQWLCIRSHACWPPPKKILCHPEFSGLHIFFFCLYLVSTIPLQGVACYSNAAYPEKVQTVRNASKRFGSFTNKWVSWRKWSDIENETESLPVLKAECLCFYGMVW